MSIKHILVHVEPGAASERRLKYALSLAQSFGASLTGLSVMLPPTDVAFAMVGDPQIYAAVEQAAAESCVAARLQFDTLTAGGGTAVRWREGNGIPVEVIAAEAGSADLVILGRDDGRDPDAGFYNLAPADVVMTCGRPVLVLPGGTPEAFRAKRVLVGWKGTPEAARAAHDALPFLTRADQVTLAEIVPKHPPRRYAISIDAIAEHLREHGAPVAVQRIAENADAGELLIRLAEENGCDLIVAGGYGHSRVREWALGGVTYSLLHAGGLPCLLSH